MIILYLLLGALAAFIIVIVARAAAFTPKEQPQLQIEDVKIDADHAAESLAMMVRCKTVSNRDKSLQDEREFEKFRELLKTRFPLVHSTCTLERVGDTGLLYKWAGRGGNQPTVLMAHYDVVPVVEEQWQKPPFEGIIEDGVLWGRGTIDTKVTLCGVMESAEILLGEGYVPESDIYFAFSGQEEIAGEDASKIVDVLESRGIKPELVVDEGGAVVEGVFPGVKDRCAVVATAEKGMMDVKFTIKTNGGHASAPPAHGPIGKLAKAVCDIENHPFPCRISSPVNGLFDILGRRSTFGYRIIFANLWCFKPLLDLIAKKSGGEFNAMLRTTFAATQAEGSAASNVLPNEAHVIANMRLVEGDTVDSAIQRMKNIVNNDEITIEPLYGSNPTIASDTSSAGYAKVSNAILGTWPGVIVAPYIMVQCSDSRHYCRITDKVMRFCALELSREERSTIHGNNEHLPVKKIGEAVEFYVRLIKQC